MRKIPPIPGNWTMFMCRPRSEACRGDLGAEGVCRRLARLVGDQFDALQQAAAPDVADLFVPVTHAGQPCPELLAENGGPSDEVVPFDDGQHGQGDGSREGIRHVGGEEQESCRGDLDLLGGDHGGHRQTRAKVFHSVTRSTTIPSR